jgi:cytochrome c
MKLIARARAAAFAAAPFALVAIGLSAPAKAQDAAAGERIFNQCRACHQVGETAKNGVGPHLNGLFGRKAGSVEGYSYSNAYKAITDKVWSKENFTTYIKDPRAVTPGTKMVYAGLKDETQIANLIAFLEQFGADGKKK